MGEALLRTEIVKDVSLDDVNFVENSARPLSRDDFDRELMRRLEHLIINVTPFLNATPSSTRRNTSCAKRAPMAVDSFPTCSERILSDTNGFARSASI